MIDKVHADAEIAAAFQDALSKEREKVLKEEEEIEMEMDMDTFPENPPLYPDLQALPVSPGHFDDLIPPWEPEKKDEKDPKVTPTAPPPPTPSKNPFVAGSQEFLTDQAKQFVSEAEGFMGGGPSSSR